MLSRNGALFKARNLSPRFNMQLPLIFIEETIGYLGKEDLLKARLINRTFQALASKKLFYKLYLTNDPETDLRVLTRYGSVCRVLELGSKEDSKRFLHHAKEAYVLVPSVHSVRFVEERGDYDEVECNLSEVMQTLEYLPKLRHLTLVIDQLDPSFCFPECVSRQLTSMALNITADFPSFQESTFPGLKSLLLNQNDCFLNLPSDWRLVFPSLETIVIYSDAIAPRSILIKINMEQLQVEELGFLKWKEDIHSFYSFQDIQIPFEKDKDLTTWQLNLWENFDFCRFSNDPSIQVLKGIAISSNGPFNLQLLQVMARAENISIICKNLEGDYPTCNLEAKKVTIMCKENAPDALPWLSKHCPKMKTLKTKLFLEGGLIPDKFPALVSYHSSYMHLVTVIAIRAASPNLKELKIPLPQEHLLEFQRLFQGVCVGPYIFFESQDFEKETYPFLGPF